MNAIDIEMNLVDNYFSLLKNLSNETKLALIEKLSKSLKAPSRSQDSSIQALYGAFISEQSAEEMIADIKNDRVFNRQRVEL